MISSPGGAEDGGGEAQDVVREKLVRPEARDDPVAEEGAAEEADAEAALLLCRSEAEGTVEEPGRVRGGVHQAASARGAREWWVQDEESQRYLVSGKIGMNNFR